MLYMSRIVIQNIIVMMSHILCRHF